MKQSTCLQILDTTHYHATFQSPGYQGIYLLTLVENVQIYKTERGDISHHKKQNAA
jgi:predicted metallo-beta-lactamase superfamily hydrolase